MFKTRKDIIVIQAEETEPNRTGVVFWSHDKGTAKMIFELQKNHVDQSLATGTKVPILLEFDSATAENGRGKHTYFATIEDAVNGIVSIILEDNILGYQGRVDGSIYIELPDSRSLDTAGRFTFHIKRSPIDEDVPELEDYYWQGFNDIMEQYHESIAEIKLEAKTTLDSLTADVTTAQNKVTTLEQSITTANTNLNARIDEINKKIDDNDVFTKAESSANVIDHVFGAEKLNESFDLNFKNKISGSVIENPNIFKTRPATDLGTPNSSYTEPGQANYNSLAALDNTVLNLSTTSSGRFRQGLFAWNVLSYAKRFVNENFFESQGAISIAEQVEVLKKYISKLELAVWGFGSSAEGSSLSFKLWSNNTVWQGDLVHKLSSIEKLEYKLNNADLVNYISNDGFVYATVYSGNSDGVTATSIDIDFTSLYFEIEISANAHIKSMIASNHVTNLATTEEAKAGTNTTKTMTPATTAQSIDNRAVTLASNQTIGGIKNFKDGLMVADTSVVVDRYIEKTVVTTNTTDFTADSTVYFQHWGRMVVASVSITNKAANFAAWKTLMQFPDGYKPNRRIGWGGTLTNNTNRAPSLSVYANDSGINVMSPSSDFPASQNCVGTIPYFTSDAWPS